MYRVDGEAGEVRILRGLSHRAAVTLERLLAEPFFRELVARGQVVNTVLLSSDDPAAASVITRGWHAVAEHTPVECVTFPYEWPFSMLRDAALLQLHLLTTGAGNGWLLKDATPFNVQWAGTRPVFIDVPSFEPWEDGEYWRGYRQFCATFLTPLLLTAHLGIPFQPLLRSRLDGIPPDEAARYFYGLRRFKRGVLSHIWFPDKAERRVRRREAACRPVRAQPRRQQPKTLLLALLDSLGRLIRSLSCGAARSDWSGYAETHSYDSVDFALKRDFVRRHLAAHRPALTWDLGANTGAFSCIAAEYSRTVIAVDADHDSIERLYRELQSDGPDNIVALVMDLANLSTGQGWAGHERPAFDQRSRPDLVLCLALVHHLRIAANIPLPLFIDWLRSLGAAVIVEWVGREDAMLRRLLENKREDYADYTAEQFEAEVHKHFRIRDRQQLKGGAREMLLLEPT